MKGLHQSKLFGQYLKTCIVTGVALVLFLMFIGAAHAQDFTYTNNNGSITITGYTGPGGAVNIPATIDGLPVTAIGDWAFYAKSLTSVGIPSSITSIGDYAFDSCFGLTSVTIPDSVTNLGVYAFPWCYSLTNVTIGNNVTAIGYWAFYECRNLKQVTIPDSVTSVGFWAFAASDLLTNITFGKSITNIDGQALDYCSSLTSIQVDALNPVYSSVDGVLFDKSQRTLIKWPLGRTGSYAIPDGVTNIAPGAFATCWSLTNLTFPDSMTRIGPGALGGFVGLTRIAIPDSVTSIGTNAFAGCFHLTTVTIGSGVTNIEDEAFAYCTNFSFALYFEGNAPVAGNDVFDADAYAKVYYLPGTTGWGSTFGGVPTAPWTLPYPLILSKASGFGLMPNGAFDFTVSWATNLPVVVEASRDLSGAAWQALQTNTLINGSFYFTDPVSTNYTSRFYRARSL
jgi:hypothetical protein